jgi:hypothetical protein
MKTADGWEAECQCGQLKIRLSGDPEYVSSCCCQACQRRTGALVGVTAFFAKEQLADQQGKASDFRRIVASGKPLDYHFCPQCGSTIWWEPQARPGRIAVAAGCIADAQFPPPQRMIWTEHRHPFVMVPDDLPLFEQAP